MQSKLMQYEYYNPVRVQFGSGQFGRIGELESVAGKRCLVATYEGFDPALLDGVRACAKSVRILDRFEENPSVSFAKEVSQQVIEDATDTIIAIGGGSTIDTAKAASYLAASPNWNPGDPPTGRTRCNLIAVPTTAGTGSEVSPYAILTDDTGSKKILSDPVVFPSVAVCDPELTTGLPAHVTADSGIDAISHTIEAYLNVKCNGHMNSLAIDSLALARENLPKVMENPQDLAAREGMMLSALEGGFLLAACGTVVVHAMGYALSKTWHLTHGRVNGLLLSRFVEIVAETGNDRARRILEVFDGDFAGFITDAGITRDEKSYELTDDLLEAWADVGIQSYGLANCVVPLDRNDLKDILVSSLR